MQPNKYPTLHDFIDAFASDANETGAARTEFTMKVEREPIGPEVEGTVTVIRVYPNNFEYLEHRFGLDGSVLQSPEQVEGRKQFARNEARAANEAKANADGIGGIVRAALSGGSQ